MPIIKDKYGAKGSNIRSKFQTRKINTAIINPVPSSESGIETQQIQESFNKEYRSSVISKEASSKLSIISSHTFSTTSSAELIFTLSQGESLNDIVIHNYNAISSDYINITISWSVGDQKDASFTISSGIITAVTGISITRLFGAEFPYLGTVSLADIVKNIFTNVSNKIYFYGSSSILGPSITFSKTSG